MTQEEFLVRLQDEIQLDSPLKAGDMLCDVDGWDSLAMLAMLNVFDEINISVDIEELEAFVSVNDILKKAGFDA